MIKIAAMKGLHFVYVARNKRIRINDFTDEERNVKKFRALLACKMGTELRSVVQRYSEKGDKSILEDYHVKIMALAGRGKWAGNGLSVSTIAGGDIKKDETILKLHYLLTGTEFFKDLAKTNPDATAVVSRRVFDDLTGPQLKLLMG